MENIGDSHNFGRKVRTKNSKYLLKPRDIFWEEQFLSERSRFRDVLEEVLEHEPIIQCLPRIRFKRNARPQFGGLVEKIKLNEIKPGEVDPKYVMEAFGGLLGLAAWFGIHDLHRDNIFFGIDKKNGNLILTSVDFEVIFCENSLPFDVGLLPGFHDTPSDQYGIERLKRLFPNFTLVEGLAATYGYFRVLNKLKLHSKKIEKALFAKRGRNAAIRVVLRPTLEYLSWFKGVLPKIPMRPEELVQLERGDIPFFFRTFKDTKVRYFFNRALTKTKYIQNQKLVLSATKSLPDPRKIFKNRNREKTLIEYGTMLIAGCFLPSKFHGTLYYRNLAFSATKTKVLLRIGDEFVLSSSRKLFRELLPPKKD